MLCNVGAILERPFVKEKHRLNFPDKSWPNVCDNTLFTSFTISFTQGSSLPANPVMGDIFQLPIIKLWDQENSFY